MAAKKTLNNPRVGVGVFIWKDGKFIMGQRLGSHGAETWSLPGGHLEFGETWQDAAVREALEETGLKVDNPRFLALTNDIFELDQKHYVTIWVETDWVSGVERISEPDKFVEQSWKTFKNLPRPLFEPCWQNLRIAKPELFA